MTTVRDTRPTPDKSWTATTFFTLFAYLLAILLFFLHLPHENRLHHFGNSFFGTRHHRHLPAVAAHHAFPAAHGSTLLQRLTQTVPMVAEPQMPRSLHPQLPREQSHPSTCQNHLPTADVGNNGLLHLLPDSTNRNKDSIVPCRCGGDLAYTVIQDVEINECANVVNVLMCQ